VIESLHGTGGSTGFSTTTVYAGLDGSQIKAPGSTSAGLLRTADLLIFLYLQLLDLMTTMIGLQLGAAEASPFIGWLMRWGPALGVALSKGVALGLAAVCLWAGKRRVIRWISFWYAGLVVWNLYIILVHAVAR
jgi:hypothetical protein